MRRACEPRSYEEAGIRTGHAVFFLPLFGVCLPLCPLVAHSAHSLVYCHPGYCLPYWWCFQVKPFGDMGNQWHCQPAARCTVLHSLQTSGSSVIPRRQAAAAQFVCHSQPLGLERVAQLMMAAAGGRPAAPGLVLWLTPCLWAQLALALPLKDLLLPSPGCLPPAAVVLPGSLLWRTCCLARPCAPAAATCAAAPWPASPHRVCTCGPGRDQSHNFRP